jgi:hypothetical protein
VSTQIDTRATGVGGGRGEGEGGKEGGGGREGGGRGL